MIASEETSDISNSVFDSIDFLYTSGHLHVQNPVKAVATDTSVLKPIAPKEKCPPMNPIEHNPSRNEEYLLAMQKLYLDGYCTLQGMVDESLINRCRMYIDSSWEIWMKEVRRPDDWRFHFMLNIQDTSTLASDPILDLLIHSPQILDFIVRVIGDISGLFYTQVAIRTPVDNNMNRKKRKRTSRKTCPEFEHRKARTDYHIDGQANQTGSRFPDYWTIIVGIALNDQVIL